MKNLLFYFCFAFSTTTLLAQETFNLLGNDLRKEVEMRGRSGKHYVLATGEDGLVMFHELDSLAYNPTKNLKESITAQQKIWEFTKYTNEFIPIWSQTIKAPTNVIYNRHYWDGTSLHVLLLHQKLRRKRPFQVISLNVETGTIKKTNGVIPFNLQVNDFSVIKQYAYIGGETVMSKLEGYGRALAATFIVPIYFGILNYQPDMVLNRVNIDEQKSKLLPITYSGSSKVESLDPSEQARSMAIVIAQSPNKRINRVFLKEYAGEKLIKDLEVNPKGDNRLLSGKIIHLNRNEFMVIGTYAGAYYKQKFWKKLGALLTGTRLPEFAQGLYIAKFEYRGQKYIKYYNFTEFENFFEAYGKRVQKKVKRKAKRKKKRGKELLMDFQLLLHDIIETDDEYLLVAESYRPEYRQEYTYDPLTGGYRGSGREIFVGYRYTHAIAAGFDKENGEMKWDNSFPIWNIISFNLKERVQVFNEGDSTTMVFNNEGYLQSRVIKDGEILASRTLRPIKTEFLSERIRSDWESDIEYWYGRNFLAWGYQRITDKDESIFSNRRNRQVFYFYKVSY